MATGHVGEFPVGSLVRIRERDWVVLPSDDTDIVCLRPLSGSESEICGIHREIEGHALKHAEFAPPKPEQAGDFIAGKLLRNAARLGLRNGAGPFRSLGRLSVRPRPYQFVPLIMALKLDFVRMLIADDVGIGKTIEAAMIARELLDRGDAQGLCVICPPHLCDQWQEELETKFHIHAKVVRTSTLARLERDLPRRDLSVYRYYKHLVVSIDFVKRDSRRAAFLSDCPDFVIVDEAHTATEPGGVGSREQQQRHQLVHEVAKERSRHILLLTATPHSGIEGKGRQPLCPCFLAVEEGIHGGRSPISANLKLFGLEVACQLPRVGFWIVCQPLVRDCDLSGTWGQHHPAQARFHSLVGLGVRRRRRRE